MRLIVTAVNILLKLTISYIYYYTEIQVYIHYTYLYSCNTLLVHYNCCVQYYCELLHSLPTYFRETFNNYFCN